MLGGGETGGLDFSITGASSGSKPSLMPVSVIFPSGLLLSAMKSWTRIIVRGKLCLLSVEDAWDHQVGQIETMCVRCVAPPCKQKASAHTQTSHKEVRPLGAEVGWLAACLLPKILFFS